MSGVSNVASIPVFGSDAQDRKIRPYRFTSNRIDSNAGPEGVVPAPLFRAAFGVLVDGSNPDDGVAIERGVSTLFKPAFGVLVDGSNPDDGVAIERRLT